MIEEAESYTTMNTAVNIEANPIHARIDNLPSVGILEISAVHVAATRVQTMLQTGRLESVLNPSARPTKPEPEASLDPRSTKHGPHWSRIEAYTQVKRNRPPATSRATGPPIRAAASAMLCTPGYRILKAYMT